MGMDLRTAVGDFEATCPYKLLPIAGADFYYLFSNRFNRAFKNYVQDGDDGAPIGSPVGHDDYYSFDGGDNYANTGADEPAQLTQIAMHRTANTATSTGSRTPVMGNFAAAAVANAGRTSNGSSIFMTSGTVMNGSAYIYNSGLSLGSSGTLSITVPNLTDWGIYVNQVGSSQHKFGDWLRGHHATPATYASGYARDPNVGLMRVGSLITPYGGVGDIAFAAQFPGFLSDADVLTFLTDQVLPDLEYYGYEGLELSPP